MKDDDIVYGGGCGSVGKNFHLLKKLHQQLQETYKAEGKEVANITIAGGHLIVQTIALKPKTTNDDELVFYEASRAQPQLKRMKIDKKGEVMEFDEVREVEAKLYEKYLNKNGEAYERRGG